MNEATSGTTFYFKATFRPSAVIFIIMFSLPILSINTAFG